MGRVETTERPLALPAAVSRAPRRGTSRERLTSHAVTAFAVDAAMLAVAGIAVAFVEPASQTPAAEGGWAIIFSLLALALLASRGLYAPRLRPRLLDEFPAIVTSTAAAAMLVIAALVMLADGAYAEWAVRHWLFAFCAVAAGRAILRVDQAVARSRGERSMPTLIVGAGTLGHRVARRLVERPQLGLTPIGFLDKEPLDVGPESVELPVLGASWDLDRIILDHSVEHVIVTFSTAPHHVLLALARRCHQLGVSVSLVPRLFEIEGKRAIVEHLGGVPVVGVDYADPKGWQFELKHAVDRVVAFLALLVTLPLLVAIAIAVRVRMGSPVIYRQTRVGRDGRRFEMLKFRTMRGNALALGEADADWAVAQIRDHGFGDRAASPNGGPGDGAQGGSSKRLVKFGSMLRRYSLDELPQLVNVLRGEMSLVGPRPERATYVSHFEDAVYRYGDRHRVKSGLTGWAQVNGLRGRTSLADRVEWDNFYVEHWSPSLDLRIVLMTLWCVVRGQRRQ